jgi:hypothetical protein
MVADRSSTQTPPVAVNAYQSGADPVVESKPVTVGVAWTRANDR